MTTPTKAVGYIRVSTSRQAEDGVSLDAQRERLTAWAAAMGLELVSIEADEGVSGRRIKNRPGLQRAIAKACACKGVLVVYSLSRMARNLRDALSIQATLDKAGAGMASLSERIDTTTPVGRMVFSILGAMDQFESERKSEVARLSMGYCRRSARQYTNVPPYGFRYVDGVMVADDAEAATLATIQADRAAGMGYRSIAAKLNAQGIQARNGGEWHFASIARILKARERNAKADAPKPSMAA